MRVTGREDSSYYLRQGAFSELGGHAAAVASLPSEVSALCRVVQGLLLHDHFGLLLYGEPPDRLRTASRATLPVSRRLDAVLAADGRSLAEARPALERSIGTCRDFALLLSAMLRHKDVPARVRCGFADYFNDAGYEDHWVCEYWGEAEGRWHLADPELDEEHHAALGIDFDSADLPDGRFLRACQAWRLCRSGTVEPRRFGHGADRGAWLIAVNLARDLLALRKREVSAWDSWRDIGVEHRALDGAALDLFDRFADLAEEATGLSPPGSAEAALGSRLETPFWRAA